MSKFSSASETEKISYLKSRLKQLKKAREPWLARWREVSDFISPYSGRFESNHKIDDRSYDLIIDNEAGRALNILVSGLSSAATSPVRQWFKLSTGNIDEDLNQDAAMWCSSVEKHLLKVFQKSNTYNSLHILYQELCLFGVGVDLIYDDFNNVIHHNILSAGEYCIATNDKGVVDTLYREFVLTTAQAVKFFGYDQLSDVVKQNFDNGKLEENILFCHAIEPREDRFIGSKTNLNMPFASYYFEVENITKMLARESGFEIFPALCPRWQVLNNEAYGISPCMIALPTVKQLQQEASDKSLIIENLADPAVQAPMSARQQPISLARGALNFTSNTGIDQQIKPINMANGDINAITQDIEMLKHAIRSDFFVDLFLLIQQAQNDRKTATEIYALKEEKMLVLGAVLERLQHELLEPLVTLTYNKLANVNFLAQAPEELQGKDITLEFQSMLAQSQRAIDVNNIDSFLARIQNMAAVTPDILDRIDTDGLYKVLANRYAVDPYINRNEQEIEDIRQQRLQQQQQMQQAEQAQALGQTAQSFAQAQKLGVDASLASQQMDAINE